MVKRYLILFFVFFLAPLVLGDDPYKPYLHKANVPEHPKVELYGSYSTNLFPGAATYSYSIEVPKGTNNLQPSLAVSYNSQAVKQRPSILGAGWTLTQNYIYRDINYTTSNLTDDRFVLVLNNANYELVYDTSDSHFHTKIETFAKVENLTASNDFGMYWLVTLKDSTQLRFGYNADSELASNMGNDYALKWSLDRILDAHGNKILYSYLEDPFPADNGTTYISQIVYNNDEKRKIEFSYEDNERPDRRMVISQGNKVEESRRLTDVNVYFDDNLVKRYNFEYNNLNNESSVTSLSKINYYGADNISLLHEATFGYYESDSVYEEKTSSELEIPAVFGGSGGIDSGARLTDLNNDGFIDIIQGTGNGPIVKAWLYNDSAWYAYDELKPLTNFVDSSNRDKGLRLVDLNLDGFPDLIQGFSNLKKVWINNKTNWANDSLYWEPPQAFVTIVYDPSEYHRDNGARFGDLNGDGYLDLMYSMDGSARKSYLNNGRGWTDVSSIWVIPEDFVDAEGADFGLRVVDVNGDGLADLLWGQNFDVDVRKAWINDGNGWVVSSTWQPPVVFTSNSKPDYGTRLADINGDGLVDIFVDYENITSSEKSAWINNGSGWIENNEWVSPEAFTELGKNIGRRIADVNGDGFADILVSYNNGSGYTKRVKVRNSTLPYLLKNITNEFGGLTRVYYSQSTNVDNKGEDNSSELGFNVWVVDSVVQENSLSGDFTVFGNTSYYYRGGKYDYDDKEFRGFSMVNETLWDNSTISHYFLQDDVLKGKEFLTETYDSDNNLYSKTDDNYNFTARNSLDSYYVVRLDSTGSYLYDGVSSPYITNVSYTYDNYSNVISKVSYGNIDYSGDEKYEYYEYLINTSSWLLDKVSKYSLYDSDDSTLLKETKYSYDSYGDLIKTKEWLESGSPVTRFSYDSYGNLIEQIDPLGRKTVYDYGIRDDTYTYVDKIINSLGHITRYDYNVSNGNLNWEEKNGIKKYYYYDVYGRIIKEIMPYDNTVYPTKSYTYNFTGEAPESIKISQKTTANKTLDTYYFYDGFGNLVQIKTPGENGQQAVKNIFYDGLFRVKSEQNPYFADFSSGLDDVSGTVSLTRYQYDSLSRVTSVTNPDGTAKSTTYNKKIIKDYDENDNYKTYYLDAYDRIIAVEEHNTDFYLGDNETYNTTYSYNGRDELVGIRDHYGNEFNFTYDSLGRKTQLDDPDLGTWSYEYDLAGNLIKQTDNIGNEIDMSYDELNRIKQKNVSSVKYNFTYDEQYQGTLSEIAFDNITYKYTYDQRLRPIKERRTVTLSRRTIDMEKEFSYDSFNRLIQQINPNDQDLDIYYSEIGKIDKIKGYVNQTNYNAFSNPLNRSYNINKITTFDYYADNARLKQIKTDTTQELNYTYDNKGNILEIDDIANNRLYSMSYDNLDRLTNASINEYRWVYVYDAIGNMLKVVRNFSVTTAFEMTGSLAHAPNKFIEFGTGADVHKDKLFNSSIKNQVIEFYLVNDKNETLTNANWTADFGDGNTVKSTQDFNISKNENILVVLEHTYSSGGNYLINLTGQTANKYSGNRYYDLIFGAIAQNLNLISQSGTVIETGFVIKNTLNETSSNWEWWCNNGNASSSSFSMSAFENKTITFEHDYSLDNSSLVCYVNSSDGNQSISLPLTYTGLEITDYNSSLVDDDSVLVKVKVKNYFSEQQINWNISSDGLLYQSSSPITINQGEETTISQQIDYTKGGLKKIRISVGSGNSSDTYEEYYFINWLTIDDFYNYVKNATSRIMNFFVNNENTLNTTAKWNITNPSLDYESYINGSDSLLVIIEENYNQGLKEPTIKVYNKTAYETKLIDIFTIKEIEISEFQTLHEEDKRAVSQAIITNNIGLLNLSWSLDNSQDTITSINNTELNISEDVIVVIESSFDEDGVYSLEFLVNSSQYNDNATEVAVS